MSYSVFRIQGIKTTGDLVGISKHNKDRVSHTNQDIDTSKSKDNIILIECNNYNSKFNDIVAPMKQEHTERMKTMRADRIKTFNQHMYFILNLCAKFSLKSQPSIYGKYGKWIL